VLPPKADKCLFTDKVIKIKKQGFVLPLLQIVKKVFWGLLGSRSPLISISWARLRAAASVSKATAEGGSWPQIDMRGRSPGLPFRVLLSGFSDYPLVFAAGKSLADPSKNKVF
jgi:hypothetical protein